MTRGRRDNTVCVVTETHDIGEARDVLDAVLNVDRADLPATARRRGLATHDSHLHPRCQVPGWFDNFRAHTVQHLDDARDDYKNEQRRANDLDRQVRDAQRQLQVVEHYARPFSNAVVATDTALAAAKDCRESLAEQLATAKRRDRRVLKPALAVAEHDIETATTLTAQAKTGLRDLRDEPSRQHMYSHWRSGPETIRVLQDRVDAIDTWRQWANGHQLTPNRIKQMNTRLFVANDTMPENLAPRIALFHDPTTAPIVRRVDLAIERTCGPEIAID
jgi:hypothetical protein